MKKKHINVYSCK